MFQLILFIRTTISHIVILTFLSFTVCECKNCEYIICLTQDNRKQQLHHHDSCLERLGTAMDQVLQAVCQHLHLPSSLQVVSATQALSTSPGPISNVHLPLPERFDGTPAHCSVTSTWPVIPGRPPRRTRWPWYSRCRQAGLWSGRTPFGRGMDQKCSPMSASPNSSVPSSTTLQRRRTLWISNGRGCVHCLE